MYWSDVVMPMLEEAEANVKALNKSEISEVRALKRPPAGVVLVLKVLCIIKNIKPVKVSFCSSLYYTFC